MAPRKPKADPPLAQDNVHITHGELKRVHRAVVLATAGLYKWAYDNNQLALEKLDQALKDKAFPRAAVHQAPLPRPHRHHGSHAVL